MDGLLINSEDIITLFANQVLEKYGRPPFTGSIRAQFIGVPDSTNGDIFHDWAKLPISREQFARESKAQIQLNFPTCTPLHGAEEILHNLSHARGVSGNPVKLALASSTKTESYKLKTSGPETKQLLGHFEAGRQVLGDDARVR